MKKLLIISTAILFSFCLTGIAFAFHDGGVAHCDGCHSMHSGAAAGPSLTKGSDASSTCLNCHNGNSSYHVNSTDGSNTTEGGDFHWTLDNAYEYNLRGQRFFDFRNAGHNMLAADFGMVNDVTTTIAPGGSFPAAGLGCTSCHDPHGQANGGTAGGADPISVSGSYGAVPDPNTQAGNYRLLYDTNKDGFTFGDAPIARSEPFRGGSIGKFVQYGSGMSNWCGNCHGGFVAATAAGGMHPVNVEVKEAYNSYVATGNFTGAVETAYDPLVPFERGVTTASSDLPDPTNANLDADDGSDTNSRVMCLTCHRAHASAFGNALRGDMTEAFLAESWIDLTSNVPATAAPYYKGGVVIDVADPGAGLPFTDGYGHYQRSLCNKCHVQD